MKRFLHRLSAGPVDRLGEEGAGEEGYRLLRRDAAACEVEEGGLVEFADGGGVGAFDVVGEDFELGLGVHRRGAGEEQALQRLLAVGFLRIAGDLDAGGDRAGGAIVGDRAPELAAHASDGVVADDEIGVMTLALAGEQGTARFDEGRFAGDGELSRSEEHTSELQVTNAHLVCRLLLEKKKNKEYSSTTKYNNINSTINNTNTITTTM